MSSGTMSRRDALRVGALSGVGLAAGAVPIAAANATETVTPATPSEALDRLMEGNQRFIAQSMHAPRRDGARIRELAGGQAPYAAILGCADSRVPPEILFDEGLGDLFTVRVAGNVASPEEIASLEYAVGVLGSKAILVLGHSSCGAVTAAVEGKAVPGQISALFQHITPAVPEGSDIESAVEANARHQAKVLTTSSPVIREAIQDGTVVVRPAVYSLETGQVRLLD